MKIIKQKIIFFCLINAICLPILAQTLPSIPTKTISSIDVKKEKSVRTKKSAIVKRDLPSTTITETKQPDIIPKATVKFLSDADGYLYIDGIFQGKLKMDIPLKVNLGKGDYLLKVIGEENKADEIKETLSVDETGIQIIYNIELKKVIANRIQLEETLKLVREQKIKDSIENVKFKAARLNYKYTLNFNDQFTTNKNGWDVLSDGYPQKKEDKELDCYKYIAYGYYHIKNFSSKYIHWSKILIDSLDSSKNFQFTANIELYSKWSSSGYGFIFGGNNEKDFYLFEIEPSGYFKVSKFEKNIWTAFKEWTACSLTKLENKENTLSILKTNEKFYFFINDMENPVFSMPFTGLFGNYFGLYNGGYNAVEYSDFRIKGYKK